MVKEKTFTVASLLGKIIEPITSLISHNRFQYWSYYETLKIALDLWDILYFLFYLFRQVEKFGYPWLKLPRENYQNNDKK